MFVGIVIVIAAIILEIAAKDAELTTTKSLVINNNLDITDLLYRIDPVNEIYEITVTGNSYYATENYLLTMYPEAFLLKTLTNIRGVDDYLYRISPGEFRVNINNTSHLDIIVTENYFKAGMEPIDKRLTLIGNIDVIKEMLNQVWLKLNLKDNNTIRISHNLGRAKNVLKRPMETVYLPENLGDSLIQDIEKFYNSLSIYRKFSVPYRRGYMLSGPPGTGKTTLVHALASYFNADINIISIDKRMDKDNLMWILDNVGKNSFVVIEDVDALYNGRETPAFGELSFSDFINIIDGLSSKEGIILFMTTNHKENIDPALLRPGRADRHISLEYADKSQVFAIFKAYLPDQLSSFDEFYTDFPENITVATLQKFFFYYLDCNNILDYKHKLTDPDSIFL